MNVSSTFQNLARGMSGSPRMRWALLDQSMISGVTFLTNVLAARFLGLEEYGRFALAWIVVLLVYAIQIAAITQPLMSIGPKKSDKDRAAYYGATFIQQLGFTALTVALFVGMAVPAGAVFPQWRIQELILPMICASATWQSQDFVRRYLFARGRPAAAFFNDVLRYTLQLGGLVWLSVAHPERLDSAAVLWLMAGVAALSLCYAPWLLKGLRFDRKSMWSDILRNWSSSKWLTASAMITWGTNNLLTFVSGAMLGATAVGALRAAQSLLGITNILFLGLENWMPSRASSLLRDQGKHALIAYLKNIALAGGFTIGVICLVAGVGAELWLRLVFGAEFAEYAYVLQGYAVAYVLMFLRHPLMAACRAVEDTQIVFTSNVLAVVVACVLAYPLLSYLALTGAVIGKIVLMGVQAAFLLYAVRRRFAD